MSELVKQALAIPGVRAAHFFKRDGVAHGVVYDARTGVEYDVRETPNGWNVNDDEGRDFTAATLAGAVAAARLGQGAGGGRFEFRVFVDTASREQAEEVIGARLGVDEDYGFEYLIDWTQCYREV